MLLTDYNLQHHPLTYDGGPRCVECGSTLWRTATDCGECGRPCCDDCAAELDGELMCSRSCKERRGDKLDNNHGECF